MFFNLKNSFGIILKELFSGEIPFKELKPNEAAKKAAIGERPNIGAKEENFRNWIIFCWHHDPQLRPTFNQILRILKEYRNKNWNN